MCWAKPWKAERIDGRADGTEPDNREPTTRSGYAIEVKEWWRADGRTEEVEKNDVRSLPLTGIWSVLEDAE